MTTEEELTRKVLLEFYTAQYKAALLGLIVFANRDIDELIDEVHMWLRYEVSGKI